jgi:hypothetical protein
MRPPENERASTVESESGEVPETVVPLAFSEGHELDAGSYGELPSPLVGSALLFNAANPCFGDLQQGGSVLRGN